MAWASQSDSYVGAARQLNMLTTMGSGVSVPSANGDNVVQVGEKRVKIVKVVPVNVVQVSSSEILITGMPSSAHM